MCTLIHGFVVGPGDFWGRLEGGLNVITVGPASWCAGWSSGTASGRATTRGYTFQGIANVPLELSVVYRDQLVERLRLTGTGNPWRHEPARHPPPGSPPCRRRSAPPVRSAARCRGRDPARR